MKGIKEKASEKKKRLDDAQKQKEAAELQAFLERSIVKTKRQKTTGNDSPRQGK